MAVIVQKFGGSSLSDLEKLGKVADLAVATRAAGNSVVVVVSAMGKTTESLLALARSAAAGGASPDFEPPRRELDMLVSTGERVSMALLSIAVQARGASARSFTGSQSGILTNDRHFDARILEVRPHRIEDALARGHIAIVAGYQGMSYRREITTLGRGGSDTTAVALAAALGAERCEIYSDVDGVYSADPNAVPGARHLPALDYATLGEMAEAGAKVLNAQAVEWARRHRVVLHARRTADYTDGAGGRETRVFEEAGESACCAIVADRKLCALGVDRAAADALFGAAEASGLPLRDVLLAGGRAFATVPLTSVPDLGRARAALETARLPGFTLVEGVAELSAVGAGVGARPERLAAALRALPEPPLFTLSGPLRLSAIVPLGSSMRAEAAWHELFVPAA